MTAARTAIRNLIENHMEKKGKPFVRKNLNEFVFNTLTDTQVLFILATDKIDTNIKEEDSGEIFDIFVKSLNENIDIVSELISGKNTVDLMLNLTNLNEYGLSSRKDSMEKMISEGIMEAGMSPVGKVEGEAGKKIDATGKAGLSSAIERAKKIKDSNVEAMKTSWDEIKEMKRQHDLIKKGSPEGEKKAFNLAKKIAAKRNEFEKEKAEYDKAKTLLPTLMMKAKGTLGKGKEVVKGVGADIKGTYKEFAERGVSPLVAKMQTGKGQAVIGGLAAASLLIYSAYKVYQRYLSSAAKSCKGRSGADKTACMKKFKLNALMKQRTELQKAFSGCAKSKDPKKCSSSIGNKIKSLSGQIEKLK